MFVFDTKTDVSPTLPHNYLSPCLSSLANPSSKKLVELSFLFSEHHLTMPYICSKCCENVFLCFWPGLGLPSHRPMLSYQKINPCQNITEKKKRVSKSAKYCLPLRYKKCPVKITMYLGLDIIIKLKFTINFNRCAILNKLNYLTKNFEF